MRNYVSETKMYDTDEIVATVRQFLLSDFRSVLDGCSFKPNDPFGRDAVIPDYYGSDVWRFKALHQIRSLTKKYRAATDPYTDAELATTTFESYMQNQVRLACRKPYKFATRVVLREARVIAREILGEYSEDEAIRSGRFGSKSNIGCPLNCAFLDHKLWSREAFTGSWVAQRKFVAQLADDRQLRDSINPWNINGLVKGDRCVDSLNLVLVPKRWDKHRPITPLPLLDLFRSFEVGRMVEERLRKVRVSSRRSIRQTLDIRTLQRFHGKLVHWFSTGKKNADFGGSHVTADLTSASDSITSELLNYILPRKWYNAVKSTFFRRMTYCGHTYHVESVLPMGNGLTFPVETLVFYCLLKAIGNLAEIDGIYSVYGDDLIYPRKIHAYVKVIFADLGLLMNSDKTYVSEPFRESCGSDSFRGVPVRPYYFSGCAEKLTPLATLSYIYKIMNGLLRRWDEAEIPGTFGYLLRLAGSLGYPLHRVPPSFPDNAGLHVSSPDISYGPFIQWDPIDRIFADGSVWYRFNYVQYKTESRPVILTEPYYWLALQGIEPWPDDWNDSEDLPNSNYRPRLIWRSIPYYIRSKDGKKIRKLSKTRRAFVPTRDGSLVLARTRKRTYSHWS